VASNTCVAPCTVTVPCIDPMAGTGEPEETVTGLGIAPCTEGASDTRLPRALETEAQAIVDGEAQRTGLVTSTRGSSLAEAEGWPGRDAVAPEPASCTNNGAYAGGQQEIECRVVPISVPETKRKHGLIKDDVTRDD
jgi:hypothetical protein